MVRTTYPTPWPDVNELIDTLSCEILKNLHNCFFGLYLHGSLAIGDFDPYRSDVDLLVVTDGELPDEGITALKSMHAHIAGSDLKWKTNFEGSYIPKNALRRYDSTNCTHPVIRVDGSFGIDAHRSEWVIQRHVIREHGIAVSGPDPRTLIDPILPNDLREATMKVLRELWEPQLCDPLRLYDDEYQAYAILTMCRACIRSNSAP